MFKKGIPRHKREMFRLYSGESLLIARHRSLASYLGYSVPELRMSHGARCIHGLPQENLSLWFVYEFYYQEDEKSGASYVYWPAVITSSRGKGFLSSQPAGPAWALTPQPPTRHSSTAGYRNTNPRQDSSEDPPVQRLSDLHKV